MRTHFPRLALSALCLPLIVGALPATGATAGEEPTGAPALMQAAVSASPAGSVDATAPVGATPGEVLEEQWGIAITSLRLTANGHMIDFRYRVLDAEKSAALFKRQTKPSLIHQPSGKVLVVPNTAKVGPLRNSNMPKEGRIYWMFFGNAGKLVKVDDPVTVVIGEFKAENLVVE